MDERMTLREAAAYLNRHPRTLQRWDREGILQAKRTVGSRRYYTQADLDYFSEHTLKVTPISKAAKAKIESDVNDQTDDSEQLAPEEYQYFKQRAEIQHRSMAEELGVILRWLRNKEPIERIEAWMLHREIGFSLDNPTATVAATAPSVVVNPVVEAPPEVVPEPTSAPTPTLTSVKDEITYRGVVPYGKKRFKAKISINGKYEHLGVYETAEEAARVYDRRALIAFGDKAQPNFPPDDGKPKMNWRELMAAIPPGVEIKGGVHKGFFDRQGQDGTDADVCVDPDVVVDAPEPEVVPRDENIELPLLEPPS